MKLNNNNNNKINNQMEKFIQSEINKLIKEYSKTKNPLVLSELKQFVDHIPNMLAN